jgi:hypothetical protein
MNEVFDEHDDIPFSGYDPDAKAWFASLSVLAAFALVG